MCRLHSKDMTLPKKKILLVGISGATCSGKTTIAKELNKILPDCTIFCQDDYYFPVEHPDHIWIPELNHINWDIVTALDMERMTRDIEEHIRKEPLKITTNKHTLNAQRFPGEKFKGFFEIQEAQCHIVIVEGFCIFNYKPLAEMCDLKYYFTLDYEECLRRRVKRVYEPPDCPGYFEKCVWPEHVKQLEEVKQNLKGVHYFNSSSTKHTEKVLKDIINILK